MWAALEHHLDGARALRRRLHAEPDLSGAESLTRDLVLEALPAASAPVKVAETGAVLRLGPPGPCVGIRGELDALPVTEDTGVAWASQRPGVMHACGHDVHLAALVAVARALADTGLPVPLLVVLQPREETYPSGARDIVAHGVLEAERCAAMIGAHLQPALAAGTVACVPGVVNASSDEFEIRVHGASGHAAYPHLTSDPLLALAEIVVALQSVVSRDVDPMAPAVVGVSSFASGAAANVVPGLARATGTLRALTTGTRLLLHERVAQVAEHVARAHGCSADVELVHGEPVLENHPALAEAIAGHLTGQGLTRCSTLRSLGADDFSFFSERIPATMLFVGSGSDEPLHSPTFLPGDDDLRDTARAMLAGYLGAARTLVHPDPYDRP
ncbi:amidohydrolase [Streptomyces sp. AJS327]|nr:amidohydrolase [Streptomyces sp. AJS327]